MDDEEVTLKKKNLGGRPRKKVDTKLIEYLASRYCTTSEIAHAVGCSPDTLERRFAAYIRKGRDSGKTTLRRKMWNKAIDQDNTVMQIFLSKQMLGYSDKVDQKTDLSGVVREIKIGWADEDDEPPFKVEEAYPTSIPNQ